MAHVLEDAVEHWVSTSVIPRDEKRRMMDRLSQSIEGQTNSCHSCGTRGKMNPWKGMSQSFKVKKTTNWRLTFIPSRTGSTKVPQSCTNWSTCTPQPDLSDRNQRERQRILHRNCMCHDKSYTDTMTLKQALHEPKTDKFIEAMVKEVKDHVNQSTWQAHPKCTKPDTNPSLSWQFGQCSGSKIPSGR